MSVKTKKGFKKISKAIAVALFALLMFTNIKIATMDSSELAKGDISLFGITVTLFDATDAYANDSGVCCFDFQGYCVIGNLVMKNAYYQPSGPCS